MIIVNLEEFLLLPKGTIYTKIVPKRTIKDTTIGICIKGETDGYDWRMESLHENIVNRSLSAIDAGIKRFRVQFCPDQELDSYLPDSPLEPLLMFAVWEWFDIESLINKLQVMFPFTNQQFIHISPKYHLSDRAKWLIDNPQDGSESLAFSSTMPMFETITFTPDPDNSKQYIVTVQQPKY